MHPLMQAAGHRLVTPTYTGLGERAHLANPSIDLESHIEDMLNVIKYEDLRDIVLLGHSYGGMVATGVADRARDQRHATDLYRCLRAERRTVAARSERVGRGSGCRSWRRAGDGWRVPPNPTPPDTSPADVEWLNARRVDMPIKCFETKLKLQGGALTLPRSYIYATRITPADTFGPFARRAKNESGLALPRDRRQPFAECHRAGSADGAAAEDRRVSMANGDPVVFAPNPSIGEGSGVFAPKTPHSLRNISRPVSRVL